MRNITRCPHKAIAKSASVYSEVITWSRDRVTLRVQTRVYSYIVSLFGWHIPLSPCSVTLTSHCKDNAPEVRFMDDRKIIQKPLLFLDF